eukprot:3601410-Rhodomonas_salina.1
MLSPCTGLEMPVSTDLEALSEAAATAAPRASPAGSLQCRTRGKEVRAGGGGQGAERMEWELREGIWDEGDEG